MSNKIQYANAHAVLRLSAKRYEQSPYLSKYLTDPDAAVFGLYANRFYPLSLAKKGDDTDGLADYWRLRRGVMLYDVPEKPLEIVGPDAIPLLEHIFTRKIGSLKEGRARYAIACTPQGGILMDGVLMRLGENHFWYVQANGPFESWLLAHAAGHDVTIRDPKSWVLQIQGPRALDVLRAAAASDETLGSFGYFHVGRFNFGGQDLLVSRTGWTGELGFEIYSRPETDHLALWDHLMEKGRPFDLTFGSLESMGIRRIEAGILDNGTDIDTDMTPFAAGLGSFVNFGKPDFVGRAALLAADRQPLLFGLRAKSGTPLADCVVVYAGETVGRITAGGWSPTLETGIGYVRFQQACHFAESWLDQEVSLIDRAGQSHAATVVALPFYDAEKKIPRGLQSDS